MADRVAVGRIVHGSGSKRIVVEPGERFDTGTLELSDEDVERMDRSGVIREPRDETGRATTAAGPGDEALPVTEGRSGPVEGGARSPAAETDPETGTDASHEDESDTSDTSGRRGRRRSSSDDL
jgi:hypothetical protein